MYRTLKKNRQALCLILLFIFLTIGVSSKAQAQWISQKNDKSGSILVDQLSECMRYSFVIRNVLEPIEVIVLRHGNERDVFGFVSSRYQFKNKEHTVAIWVGNRDSSYYYYAGDKEEFYEAYSTQKPEEMYKNIRKFVREMMDHDSLTIEVKFDGNKNEYPTFDLSGLTETLTPYLEDFGFKSN